MIAGKSNLKPKIMVDFCQNKNKKAPDFWVLGGLGACKTFGDCGDFVKKKNIGTGDVFGIKC